MKKLWIRIVLLVSITASLILIGNDFARNQEVAATIEKIVFIDPGHGGKDDGASRNDVVEDEINLKIASKLFEICALNNFVTYITRSGDYDLASQYAKNRKREDLKKRVQAIADANADLFISIHLNALNDETVHGPMVYYRYGDTESKALAEIVQQDLNELAKVNKKPHSEDYYLFRNTKCNGILIECGFISNYSERQKLLQESYQNELAQVIYGAVYKYFSKAI